MKNNKVIQALMTLVLAVSTSTTLLAHSGRTDSYGGHRDNQNKSGLGSYHYHCGGYPAHLHTNGVCPYSATSEEIVVSVSEVKIIADTTKLKVGESKKLTVEVSPSNVSNKNVTWRSSDEKVVSVNSAGTINALKEGTAIITAEATNGRKDTVTITVKADYSVTVETISTNAQMSNSVNENLKSNEKSDDSDVITGVVAAGVIGARKLCYIQEK